MKKVEEIRESVIKLESIENNNMISKSYLCGVLDALDWVREHSEDNDLLILLKSLR